MPITRRAGKRRLRARTAARRAKDPFALLLAIEEPLRDATQYIEALRLIGHGLELHDETGGNAVAALARIAALRLKAVEEVWNKVLEAGRRQRS